MKSLTRVSIEVSIDAGRVLYTDSSFRIAGPVRDTRKRRREDSDDESGPNHRKSAVDPARTTTAAVSAESANVQAARDDSPDIEELDYSMVDSQSALQSLRPPFKSLDADVTHVLSWTDPRPDYDPSEVIVPEKSIKIHALREVADSITTGLNETAVNIAGRVTFCSDNWEQTHFGIRWRIRVDNGKGGPEVTMFVYTSRRDWRSTKIAIKEGDLVIANKVTVKKPFRNLGTVWVSVQNHQGLLLVTRPAEGPYKQRFVDALL